MSSYVPLLYSEEQLAAFIQQYFLPFTRLSAMFTVMPVIGARTVSPRVRLILALLLTVIVVPLLPPLPKMSMLSFSVFIAVLQEVAIGLLAGFVFQLVFQAFVLSGQIIAMKMGLGFASMNDPTNGVQTTVISQFFLMLVTLVFVSSDGHLVLIRMIVESFYTLPPGVWLLRAEVFLDVASLAGWMFGAALVFALPVVTSLLLVNIAFGVMSRAAPQLNIFAVGFPFTLVVGLIVIWISLDNFLPAFEDIMQFGFLRLESLLEF